MVAFTRALRRNIRLEVLLAGVERAKTSEKWTQGYIPHPATWLNQDRCYDDDGGTGNVRARGAAAVQQWLNTVATGPKPIQKEDT